MDQLKLDAKYIENLKAKAQENTGSSSEYAEIVGEITDFLNENRGKYGPWTYNVIGQKVGYIWSKGGPGDLRKFRDDVRSKGSWFFWWITNPKKDPQGNIK